MPEQKTIGKFWPYIRPLIWQKAQEPYQMENAKTMYTDYKGITATKKELREGGYFHTAKLIILREISQQKKRLPTPAEEETITENSILPLKNRKPKIAFLYKTRSKNDATTGISTCVIGARVDALPKPFEPMSSGKKKKGWSFRLFIGQLFALTP